MGSPIPWIMAITAALVVRLCEGVYHWARDIRAQWRQLSPLTMLLALYGLLLLNALVPKPPLRIRALMWLAVGVVALYAWGGRRRRAVRTTPGPRR